MNPISNQRNSKYKLSDYIGGKANIYPFTSSQNMYFAKIFNVLIWVLSCWLRCKSPGLLVFSFPLKLYDRIFFILVDECTFSQVTNNHHQYVSWQIRHCCFQIAIKADTDKTCRDVSLIREARVIIIKLHRDDQEWQTSALSTAKKKTRTHSCASDNTDYLLITWGNQWMR